MYVSEFSSNADVAEAYSSREEDCERILKTLNESKVYLAWYGYGSFSGYSIVIFEHNGILYEVNASHCSCYGLEDQWYPEETNWKAIGRRRWIGEFDDEETVQKYIDQLCAENT